MLMQWIIKLKSLIRLQRKVNYILVTNWTQNLETTFQSTITNSMLHCSYVGDQNVCLARDEHIRTELNLDGNTPNDATMNDVNENGTAFVMWCDTCFVLPNFICNYI
jgi:hypothetical protein